MITRFCLLACCLTLTLRFVINHAPHAYNFPNIDHFPEMPVSELNPVTKEGVELGRHLFYEPLLSRNNTISCASCHQQEHAFSDAPNALSQGIDSALQRRNTPPLFNLAWYDKMFWDGRANSIEEQVFHPIRAHDEMDSDWKSVAEKLLNSGDAYKHLFYEAFGDEDIDSNRIALAIAQFERTLISHNSKYDQVLRGETYLSEQEFRGFVLVNDQTEGACLHCHTTDSDPLGTTGKFSNNGLDEAEEAVDYSDYGLGETTQKSEDHGHFKIPSLRNLLFTAPYMHDGRFNTLEEVLDFYSAGVTHSVNIDSKMHFAHQGGAQLTDEEKADILAFLSTLSDSTFIGNPEFSSPFPN